MMASLIRDPLSPAKVALVSSGVAVGVAIYCLVYTRLTGNPESLGQALGWTGVNILPWIVALEGAKRARGWAGAAVAISGGLAASMLLGLAIAEDFSGAFELWRRVPALAAVTLVAAGLRWNISRQSGAAEVLPLLPRQIEWVRAAGNYVELRSNGRTVIHRASMSAAERDLARHGFVRIHRSTLVRRDRIARVRPADVVLDDGTHLKIGKRYRAALQD